MFVMSGPCPLPSQLKYATYSTVTVELIFEHVRGHVTKPIGLCAAFYGPMAVFLHFTGKLPVTDCTHHPVQHLA